MNHLYRELAPISAAAWQEIEHQAKRTLKTTCAARKPVDFIGPKGWQASAVSIGRSRPIHPPSHAKLHARLRRALATGRTAGSLRAPAQTSSMRSIVARRTWTPTR